MEAAAPAVVSVRAAHCGAGAAGVGGSFLAAEQQERSADKGRSSHRGVFPPLLQCWRRGREGAMVRHQGSAEQVKLTFGEDVFEDLQVSF